MALRRIAMIASFCFTACDKPPPPPVPAREPSGTDRAPPTEKAAANGASTPPAEARGDTGDTARPVVATVRFSERTEADKRAHMKDVVQPQMARAFAAFDAERFGGRLTCWTCHGYAVAGAPMGHPSGTLPRLRLSGDGLKQLRESEPEITAFMTDVVVPTMAAAMGEPAFDPATGKGFGCAGCHAVQ